MKCNTARTFKFNVNQGYMTRTGLYVIGCWFYRCQIGLEMSLELNGGRKRRFAKMI